MKFATLILCVSVIWTEAAQIQSRTNGGRIIGGAGASTAQFPYAAALYRHTPSGTFFCSATLLNNQWLLTSAQCVQSATTFEVRLGSTSLSSNDPSVLRLSTDQAFSHPDYTGFENDIALIRLRMPITFTDYIRPISILPSTTLPTGSNVITFGWGQVSDTQPGPVDLLNYVFLVTLSNEECRLAYGNVIVDSMVCAEGNFNEGTCRGDLGSPLVQLGGSSSTYLVAVASFISSNGCESTDPSGFTRVSPYVDWINDVILNN